MRRVTVIGVVGLLAAIGVMIFVSQVAVAQPGGAGGGGRPGGGGRGGGGFGAIMYVERTWSALAFEIKISNQQLEKLRPSFQAAWDKRQAAFKKAMQDQNWQALGSAMEKVQAELEAKIKQVLTKEQWAKLQKWEEAQRQMMRPPRGGAGGPGGGRRPQ